jgi:hypothetical protein
MDPKDSPLYVIWTGVPLKVLVSPLLYLVLLNLEDVAELAEGERRVGPELELGPVVGRRLLQRTVPKQCHQSDIAHALSNHLSMHLL